MRDLTPQHMRCSLGMSCPAILELDDGRLLIIGARAPLEMLRSLMEAGRIDPGIESAIIIDPALLAGLGSLK